MQPLLAQLELAAPVRLLALVVVVLVLAAGLLSTAWLDRNRRILTTLCRALALTALVLAWAGMAWRGPTSRTFVVVGDDRSDSAQTKAQELAATIPGDARLPFAGQTSTAADALGRQASPFDVSTIDPLASDPALAVTRAAALVPDEYVGHVVLHSDGRATRDGLLPAAKAQGLPVHAVTAPAFPGPEVCVAEIVAPMGAAALAPFEFEVIVTANHADAGRLEVRIGDAAPQVQDVKLTAGENRFRFRAALDNQQPALVISATISGCQDTYPANNTRRAVVTAGQKPRVLLVAREAAGASDRPKLIATSLGDLGFQVDVDLPAHIPVNPKRLENFDAIILSNVPPQDVSNAQRQWIDQFVRAGGGLLVFGGEAPLGPKALAGTWLESLLPVTAAEERQQQKPSLALVLIIDRSESMLEERRLDLAKEAARRTANLDVIAPADQVGVLVFGDQSQWISPLAPAADKQALLKAIDTLKAEGTTNMAPAMERARLALSQAAADRKHVILLSDGVSTPGDFDRIARAMAAAGITVSTVSVSQGADQTILRDIAQVAGGRHYHCDDPREVPHILETETRNTAARGAAAEIRPMIYKRMDGLEVGKAPALLGYVATNPKPDAELWLLTPGGDPLLAGITHGTGRVVAMAADIAGPAAVHWQRWDGYGPFLARLARHVLKPRGPEFRITTERRFGQLTITLHKAATVGRGPVRNVSLISKFVGDDGKGTVPATQSMVEEVDGKYVTMVDTTATGIYNLTIRANDSDGQPIEQRLAIAVDYPDELQFGPADDKLLTAVASATGGRVLTDPAQGVPPDGRAVERVIRLWPPLVMAAMLLLVVEVALRRLVGPPCRGGPHVSGKESERVSAACH